MCMLAQMESAEIILESLMENTEAFPLIYMQQIFYTIELISDNFLNLWQIFSTDLL